MSTTLLPGDCPSAVEGVTVCPPSWAEDPQYQGMSSYFGGESPLSLTVGYLVVLGFGALFSVFTTLVVFMDKTFAGNASITSEHFKWVLYSSFFVLYWFCVNIHVCITTIAIEKLWCNVSYDDDMIWYHMLCIITCYVIMICSHLIFSLPPTSPIYFPIITHSFATHIILWSIIINHYNNNLPTAPLDVW